MHADLIDWTQSIYSFDYTHALVYTHTQTDRGYTICLPFRGIKTAFFKPLKAKYFPFLSAKSLMFYKPCTPWSDFDLRCGDSCLLSFLPSLTGLTFPAKTFLPIPTTGMELDNVLLGTPENFKQYLSARFYSTMILDTAALFQIAFFGSSVNTELSTAALSLTLSLHHGAN